MLNFFHRKMSSFQRRRHRKWLDAERKKWLQSTFLNVDKVRDLYGIDSSGQSNIPYMGRPLSLDSYYCGAMQLPLKERVSLDWSVDSVLFRTPQYSDNSLSRAFDFRDYGHPSDQIVSGLTLLDREAFTYQNSDTIKQIKKTGQANVTVDVITPDMHPNHGGFSMNLPPVKGPFAEAIELMILEDAYMFAHDPSLTYALVTREEVVGPDIETRLGLNLHTDGPFIDMEGKNHGQIVRAWNAVSMIPTANVKSVQNMALDELQSELAMVEAFSDTPEAAQTGIVQTFKKAGVTFQYVPECQVFGFIGGKGGYLHCAQPILNGAFTNSAGNSVTIENDQIRRMATLFVLDPNQSNQPLAGLY